MTNGFFLVTGTSRGIGEALAQELLDRGHLVLGVARHRSAALDTPRYQHHDADLADAAACEGILARAALLTAGHGFDFVCLVNNASATDPVGTIENCAPRDIQSHLQVGLVAPLVLTSLFFRVFANFSGRRKVAFISSGAAVTPIPGESVYCAAKAGLNMFARCVGLEQQGRAPAFELVAIGPGMVDTAMQESVRGRTREEFPMGDFFRKAHADGRLQPPRAVAEQIVRILETRTEPGKYVTVGEV